MADQPRDVFQLYFLEGDGTPVDAPATPSQTAISYNQTGKVWGWNPTSQEWYGFVE